MTATADTIAPAPSGARLLPVTYIPWQVVPLPEPEAKHWVGKKFMIAPTKIVARRTVRLLQTFTHPAFKDITVGPETNLAVTSQPLFTACVPSRYESGANSFELPCFVDSDSDGAFDKVFRLSLDGEVQTFEFRLPKADKIYPITPIALRELRKDETGATAWAYLFVDEFHSRGVLANAKDSIRMQVVFVSKASPEMKAYESYYALTELLKVPTPKDGPVDFDFLGATYTVSDFWIHGNPALPWQKDGPGGMNIERKGAAPGGDLLPLLKRSYDMQNGCKD